MNNLRLAVTVSSLGNFESISTDTYRFIVKFFNSADAPLGNPNIANVNTVDVTTTSLSFTVNVPITEGVYSIPNVTIKLFSDSDTDCCFASQVTDINNTGSTGSFPVTIGTYSVVSDDRRFDYIASPTFIISFNNGEISDATPGLVLGNSTTPNKIGGKNVYYMTGYQMFGNNGDTATRAYNTFQNIYFPDVNYRNKTYTIRQIIDVNNKWPNIASFVANIGGYGANGVNKYNAILAEVNFTVHTLGVTDTTKWNVLSRDMKFVDNMPNLAFSDKVFAMGLLNKGNSATLLQSKGVHPELAFGPDNNQPFTWKTFKKPGVDGGLITNAELYAIGRAFAMQYGATKNTIWTSEFIENTQGMDSTIEERMYYYYQGIFDYFRETEPTLNVKDTNLFGEYGIDDATGVTLPGHLYLPESYAIQALSTHATKHWNPSLGQWDSYDCQYYTSGQINVRNINTKQYFYNNIYNFPYEFAFILERVAYGTRTYQGQDRLRRVLVFTTTLIQTLVKDEFGIQFGLEETKTGELIPFINGAVMSKFNTPSAAPAGEYYHVGFWGTYFLTGALSWGSGELGLETTKINHSSYENQPIKWIKTGFPEENYVSGQNGAPINSQNGLTETGIAIINDCLYLGHADAKSLFSGYNNVAYSAAYTSSRKTFTPTAGSTGRHIGSNGAINAAHIYMKKAYDQKCGLACIGVGSQGYHGVYYNGHLSPHEYEDNVILTYGSYTVSFGRVYGRQTVWKKIPTVAP